MKPTKVNGSQSKGRVMLYALSTCIWCRKTKKLLERLDVGYDYIDVDLLEGSDEEMVMAELRKYNPACTFPTMVIDGQQVIVGYREAEIKKALG